MVVGLCTHKGGQHCHYGLMLSCSLGIIQVARPDIGDPPLTLISRMGQQACCLAFRIYSRRIFPLWIEETMQPFDCQKDQTKIVDAPLTLTFETYHQSFCAKSVFFEIIPSLLTAVIPFQVRIICIQKH